VEARVRIGADVTAVVTTGPATTAVSLLTMEYVLLVMSVPLVRGEATRTTSWTEPEAPAASEAIDQETTEPERVPPEVALTKEVLAGMVSLMTTPVALALPELE